MHLKFFYLPRPSLSPDLSELIIALSSSCNVKFNFEVIHQNTANLQQSFLQDKEELILQIEIVN
jgi:hypothetical protein